MVGGKAMPGALSPVALQELVLLLALHARLCAKPGAGAGAEAMPGSRAREWPGPLGGTAAGEG